MKKFAKRLLMVCAAIVVIFLGFLVEEHFRGEHALNSKLKQLAAKEEKLDYRDLVPPKIPAEQNAALAISSLTNELNKFFELSKSAPSAVTLISPGHAVAAWQKDRWQIDKKISNSWTAFGPAMTAANESLAKLENLWTKNGFDDGYDYNEGFSQTNVNWQLIDCKQTSVLLSEAVQNDLRQGEYEPACKHLHSILAITRALETQPLIISQLVDGACEVYAWNGTWSALQADHWTDGQLAELQLAWETLSDFPSAMDHSFMLERAMALDYFAQLRRSRSQALNQIAFSESLPEWLTGESLGPPTHGFVMHYLHLPVWQIAWASQDELHAMDKWTPLVEAAGIARTKSWADVKNKFLPSELEPSDYGLDSSTPEKLDLYDRCRFLFSAGPFSVSGSTLLRSFKFEIQKNMAITAIALKRYQLRHGKYPSELNALIPDFLNAIPLDRMDGKPLRYHLNADGSFKLYSVGLNGMDDDGDANPEKPLEHFGNIWQGRDAVWPAPVSVPTNQGRP